MADNTASLFEIKQSTRNPGHQGGSPERTPLAEQLRPAEWESFITAHLEDKEILARLQSGKGRFPSLLLWGPPGSGKTTLARLLASKFNVEFVQFSAVLSGVKDVRLVIERAKSVPRPTVLFVDEIHRFSKSQQDAFLPHVESGTISLIGATTENPSFYLNSALLSRMKVVNFKPLSDKSMLELLERACIAMEVELEDRSKELFVKVASGDARRLIGLFEEFSLWLQDLTLKYSKDKNNGGETEILTNSTENLKAEDLSTLCKSVSSLHEKVEQFLFHGSNPLRYDRDGEERYNIISAFIKSMRGSDPDAALYWGFRMLEGGEDPMFVIRRMIIFASEDIGNADPRALQLSVATADAFERLGMPEGRIPIAHCMTYLAAAPKSNRSYAAMHKALGAVKQNPDLPVPLHLRNAPTELMVSMGYAKGYRYPHDEKNGYVKGAKYLPEKLVKSKFYEPADRGYEKKINEWLGALKK